MERARDFKNRRELLAYLRGLPAGARCRILHVVGGRWYVRVEPPRYVQLRLLDDEGGEKTSE